MTSDAKIGLLLGLVFIFVIAFIINGLPNIGARAQSAEVASSAGFDSDNIGLADQARSAQERLDWDDLLNQNDPEETAAATEAPSSEPEAVMPELEPAVVADNTSIRAVYSLDGIFTGVSRTVDDVLKGLTEATEMQTSRKEPVPELDIPPASGPGLDERSSPTPRTTQSDPKPAEPAQGRETAARRLLARTYEVQEGDVLATVAKKVYGPVEGNRLVNIRRIYSANALVLNSPDEIFVGQTLVIPPLPETTQGAETPNPTLSEALFEKVETVGRRNLADVQEPKSEGRWYVVQEGDSLWKIASTQLGSGARCDEIAKMNTDVLKDKQVLNIGMRLRLPSK